MHRRAGGCQLHAWRRDMTRARLQGKSKPGRGPMEKSGGAPEERRRLPAAGLRYGEGLQVPSQTAPKLPMMASQSRCSQAAKLIRHVPAVSRPAPAGP